MSDEARNEQNQQEARQIMTENEANIRRREMGREMALERHPELLMTDPMAFEAMAQHYARNPVQNNETTVSNSERIGEEAFAEKTELAQTMAAEAVATAFAEGAGAAAMISGALAAVAESFPVPPDPQFPFVVRGAKVYCTYGTHITKLDMPLTHGAFLHEKPMLNALDCKVGINYNIAPFGICRSQRNKNQQIDIHEANREELVPIDVLPDGTWVVPDMPLEGRKCIPCLTRNRWADANTQVLLDGEGALTTGCTVACSYGGVISFITHGQEED